MLNLLENIILETEKDDKLFARYAFKFYDEINNNIDKSLQYVFNMPKFKSKFQLIFMSGLIEHFYKNNLPSWIVDDKLSAPWGYISGYNINESSYEKNNGNYLPELTKRGIYAI